MDKKASKGAKGAKKGLSIFDQERDSLKELIEYLKEKKDKELEKYKKSKKDKKAVDAYKKAIELVEKDKTKLEKAAEKSSPEDKEALNKRIKEAIEAAEMALSSPLLEQTIDGAKGVLFNITGGTDLSISEIEIASQTISSVVDPDANIIFGTVTDERLTNEMRITLIGTGFPKSEFTSPNSQNKTRSNSLDSSSQTHSKSSNIDQNDLDIPPFLRK